MILQAREEERSFRSSMEETPFADRLVDSRSDLFYADHGMVCTDSSFRFNVGNGFVLDYSVIHAVPSTEFAVSVLETILPLVPLMKDGVEIEVDNHEPGIENACDGFKTRPPGNTHAGSDTKLFESSREEVDEFDGMPIYRITYCYEDPDVFEVEPPDYGLSYPVFYSVKYGDIHVLFPSRPTPADLEWVSGIRPYLESLSQLLPRVESLFFLHFILWRDGSGAPSDKTT